MLFYPLNSVNPSDIVRLIGHILEAITEREMVLMEDGCGISKFSISFLVYHEWDSETTKYFLFLTLVFIQGQEIQIGSKVLGKAHKNLGKSIGSFFKIEHIGVYFNH